MKYHFGFWKAVLVEKIMLGTAILAAILLLSGCMTKVFTQNSEGYEIENPETHVKKMRPDWVKEITKKPKEDGQFKAYVQGHNATSYRSPADAFAYTQQQALKDLQLFLYSETKSYLYDYVSEQNKNGKGNVYTESVSYIKTIAEGQIHSFKCEREYWEAHKGKAGLYYWAWAEYSIPPSVIEQIRKDIIEETKLEEINKRIADKERAIFSELINEFSRRGGVEEYFSNIDKYSEFPELEHYTYINFHKELGGIHSNLTMLNTLKNDSSYKEFTIKTQKMLTDFNPAKKIVTPIYSKFKKLEKLEIEYREQLAMYRETVAGMKSRIYSLEEERNGLRELFNNLTHKVEQWDKDVFTSADKFIETISSWKIPASRELAKAKQHTVKSGETLVKIARQEYGSGLYYIWVYRCNSSLIKNPDLIHTGAKLRLPSPPENLTIIAAQDNRQQTTNVKTIAVAMEN